MELDSHEDGAEQEAELHEQAESVSPTGVFFDRPGRINVLRLQLGQAGGFNVRQGDDLAHQRIGCGSFNIMEYTNTVIQKTRPANRWMACPLPGKAEIFISRAQKMGAMHPGLRP